MQKEGSSIASEVIIVSEVFAALFVFKVFAVSRN